MHRAEKDLAQLSFPGSQPSLTRIHFSHYRQAAGWHISKKKRMGGNVWPFSVHSLESDMWFKCVREREKKWGETGCKKEGRGQMRVGGKGMKTEEAFLIRGILHFWHLETLIHRGYRLWSNNVSINVERIIMNAIIPLKCQPSDGKGCARCMQNVLKMILQ